MMTNLEYKPGLEGVVAAQTRRSYVNGQLGQLLIAGYPLADIAGRVTAEEVVYLLWHDRLPNAAELADLKAQLAALRPLPPITLTLLQAIATAKAPVMDALRMAAGTLSLDLDDADANTVALALVARFPTIVAAYWRLCQGLEPVAPTTDLGHAANYLYMLKGERPSPAEARGMATYLNTVSDHGLNVSSFTARVIVSTRSDLVSAITGAVGALKGPLHGGAPGPALDMVFEIGQADRAEAYLRDKIEHGERLMGFGHRVYKVRDPRADVLAAAAESLYLAGGDMALYELAKSVEVTAVALLEEYKPGRNLKTNVEFYTALLLHGLGLSTDLFTPTFAVGRVAGWLAHCFEEMANGRLIRPKEEYIGEMNRQWVPLEERG
jgi:citrate synthase